MPQFPVFKPAATSYGAFGLQSLTVPTQITCGTNAKNATYTELISSVPEDSDWICIYLAHGAAGATWTAALIDIAIGASGSEVVIIENLAVVWNGSSTAFTGAYQFPIKIKAGQRLSANGAKTPSTGANPYCQVICGKQILVDAGSAFSSSVRGYGADVANSRGTSIDCGGTASTKGAWVPLSTSTSQEIREVMVWIGPNLNTGLASGHWFRFDIGVGASGSEVVVVPDIPVRTSATIHMHCLTHRFPVWIPQGSRLSMRGESTNINATDRVLDGIVYGMS